MSAPAIECFWTGDAFKPINPVWAKRAAKEYVQGEIYSLVSEESRSTASHGHYFASLTEAWRNLPERLGEQFHTSEHLRKYCLIKAGYCDTMTMPCPSHAAALRFAAMARSLDEYALVVTTEAVVTIYRAKSQSYKAMSKAEFQDSKTKVLDILAGMIGVTVEQLKAADAPTPVQYMAAG